jgi:transcription elongation GreA/GreB family factor
MKEPKQEIIQQLSHLLSKKVEELVSSINSAKESRDNDTKSSAGDKHETSRALVQIEIEKLEVQLDKTLQLQKELSSIYAEKAHQQVEPGSLVYTNHENYFISVGMGKLVVQDEIYYAISLASPLGQLLKGKVVGEKVELQGREILINKIV